MSPAVELTPSRRYRAYLLRLWQVESDGCPAWRASLEDTHTGERCGFATLEGLFAFLDEGSQSSENRTLRSMP